MNLPRQAGGKFAPRTTENSYGDVPADTVAEAPDTPFGQAKNILKAGKPSQLVLPEIVRVDLPAKNRTKDFYAKYDHLMKMEVMDALPVEEGKQSTWGYTIREVIKDNAERKYKFVRTREGLFLQRKA